MAETTYLTMTREKMLDVRWKADNREQPDALYSGQRIIGYSEYHTGSLGGDHGHWRAIVVLADGTRIEIGEQGRG
jgi:hypothetical protein